ncbi:MAG: methylglyoxal synthase [Faecalibacterium sp.]
MTIAILAHDSRKELALQFCTAYSAILTKHTIIATGTTGRMLAQATGLAVQCYLSGRLGGIQQISSRIACDEVDLVLFFRDPLKADAANLTEQNLLRLCDMHGVPIATNIATAEVLLRGLDQGDLDYREGLHAPLADPLSAPMSARRAVC